MDKSKNKRTTTRVQFQLMVDQMKNSPDIAKNMTKRAPEISQHFWQNLKDDLNSLGPPIKEISEWKKVWSDHKSALKKKLAHNKRQFTDSGGGENNKIIFTELEEDVIQLVCLREAASGVTGARSYGDKTKHSSLGHAATTSNIEEIVLEEEIIENADNIEIQSVNPPQKKFKTSRQIKLLEKQINIQTLLYEEVTKNLKACNKQQEQCNYNFKKITRSLERVSDREKARNEILQAQLDETKRHNAWMEKFSYDKGKIKKQFLEFKLSRINKNLLS